MSIIEKWKLILEELLVVYKFLFLDIKEFDFGYSKEDFLYYLLVNEFCLVMEELDGVMENNISFGVLFWEYMINVVNLMN